MDIHLLTEQDAQEFHALRLRSLREHPEAYGASFEEEQHLSVEQVARQLGEGLPDSFTLGARVDGTLVGIISLFRFPRQKTRHKAILGGMYVAPEARDRKSTRLNSSHANISYAVFCLKKKKKCQHPLSLSHHIT